MLIHSIHRGDGALARGGIGDYGPGVALEKNLSLFVLAGSDLAAAGGDATDVPLAVPEFLLAGCADFLRHGGVFLNVFGTLEVLCGFDKGQQRPVVQERDHGALAAAQIEAVVPVGAETFADSRLADLRGREIERALQVFVDGGLALVGEGNDLLEEFDLACFFHVLADRGH